TAVVEFLSRNSSITKSESIVGFEPNGFVVIGYSSVEVAFVRIGDSPAVKGKSVVGIETNGFSVISYSSVVVAFALVGVSAAIKGGRVIGAEAYRLAEVRDSFVKATTRVSRVTFFNRGQVSFVVCFRLGCCSRLAFLVCLNSREPLLLSLLRFALCICLGRCSYLTFLLCLSCCREPLLLSLLRFALCVRLGRPALFLPLKLDPLHALLYQMPKECIAAHAN